MDFSKAASAIPALGSRDSRICLRREVGNSGMICGNEGQTANGSRLVSPRQHTQPPFSHRSTFLLRELGKKLQEGSFPANGPGAQNFPLLFVHNMVIYQEILGRIWGIL